MDVISILIREKIKNMHMTPLRTIHTHELELNLFRWIKISALEITIFGFRLILKSCLDIYFFEIRPTLSELLLPKVVISRAEISIHFTEVRFASFLSGRFTTTAVKNQLEKRLAKRTSVHL